MSPRPTCFAYDADTQLRCSRPGGHAGLHRVSKEFDDDTAWVPILTGADLAAQISEGVVTPLRRRGVAVEPVEVDTEGDAGGHAESPGKVCVVCQHTDDHPTPEDAGDSSGCSHPGCECLTAVWV